MTALYVHFPFCARICSYCDFAVLRGSERLHQEFGRLIVEEARIRWPRDGMSFVPRTVYWGGGTPSELSAPLLLAIGEQFQNLGLIHSQLDEFTVECNPESTTVDRLNVFSSLGVDRWSLGVQTFDAALLNQLGRQATPAQSRDALQLLRETGKRLSLDFMFCLPGQSATMFLRDLEEACSAEVQHVSFYGLEIHAKTLLGQQVRKNPLIYSDRTYADFYQSGVAYLESQGILRYEVSNFAAPGQESIHNRSYWERQEYLGLGPGAHSFLNGCRWAAPRKYQEWLHWVEAACPLSGMENDPIGPREALMETVWLGLRQKSGIRIDKIQNTYGNVLDLHAVDRFAQNGWVSLEDGNLRLVDLGWIFMDQVVAGVLKD